MLKWTVIPEERRRRQPNFTKRRKLSFTSVHQPKVNNGLDLIPSLIDSTNLKPPELESELEPDSKSVFYMSLDHVPTAIVKQYEKMIQETETRKKEPDQKTDSEMISLSEESRIKEAIHRPLKVSNQNRRRTGVLLSTQRYSDAETDSDSDSSSFISTTATQVDHDVKGIQVVQKPILKRTPPDSTVTSGDSRKIQFIKTSNQITQTVSHDSTDPGFLSDTTPLSPSREARETRISSRVTLKRRELRKLEKLRSESEKLTKFLRKYYYDCLPKGSPEDEVDLSPEEKTLTVFLGQLAKSMMAWDRGLDGSSDSTTTDSSDLLTSSLPVIAEDTEGSSEDKRVTPLPPSRDKPLVDLNTPRLSLERSEIIDEKVKGQRTPRRKKVLAKPKTPGSSSKTRLGEVLVKMYRNENYVTLHVLEARNLTSSHFVGSTPSQQNSAQISFKVSLLDAATDTATNNLQASSWQKVNRGQSRIGIDQKFSFDTFSSTDCWELGEENGKVKVFLSFWKRQDKRGRKGNTLLGWTRAQLVEDQQVWIPLRRDKMLRNPPLSDSRKFDLEAIPETKGQSSTGQTMDSGVEDCGSDQFHHSNSGSQQLTQTQLVIGLSKEPSEVGFGFSVVWSSPPQIGRITLGTAADRGGLRRGDILYRVNDQDIGDLQRELIIQKMKAFGNIVELEVLREYDDPYGGDNVQGHRHCSCVTSGQTYFPQPPPTSVLKPRPPPLPLNLDCTWTERRVKTCWRIRFHSTVGQGTIV